MNTISLRIGLLTSNLKYVKCPTFSRQYVSSTHLILVYLQLEKLLSKNYYLHQSAKEGYRSYLQSYASYSLKKIFDVKKLDLAKVGKAFGFSVPPRVNVNMGEQPSSGKRKRHGLDAETETESEPDQQNDAPARAVVRHSGKDKGKEKRKEQLGKKQVEKEVYRKEKIRKVDDEGKQWTR